MLLSSFVAAIVLLSHDKYLWIQIKTKNPFEYFDTGTKRDLAQLNWFHSISMALLCGFFLRQISDYLFESSSSFFAQYRGATATTNKVETKININPV